MRIEHCAFGKIVVDSRTYSSDVILYPDRVDATWRRKEGHYLEAADLTGVVNANPDILIIGTGFWGVMVVPDETVAFLGSKGISVRVERTGKAAELFNQLGDGGTVVAALHLTC
ncbi:MAG: MTH938/NDUFAF3 family protein [Nitrospiraceae bacterium]|nr:MTH938/NDUFAF3 family protein [Nitrospiraceae bacterium]